MKIEDVTEPLSMGTQSPLHNFDKVKLVKPYSRHGSNFPSGTKGIILYCYDDEAYEVEFANVQDAFTVSADFLEKI
jgi:hypothetical protein